AQNSAAYLIDSLPPDADILDVGCGPGTITSDLAVLSAHGRVVGVDAAADVLAEARTAARGRNLANVSFETGDVYHLAFPEGSFDVVHAHQLLQHLSDPVAALAEMSRVCRPGGIVAARDSDYAGMFWYPESEGLTDWLALYRRVATAIG